MALSFKSISFITFEIVLQVGFVCFIGWNCAKSQLLNSSGQKLLSQLNVDIFTPCLVFTKLAPSLSLGKLKDLIIIPLFYILSTTISFICSCVISYAFGFNKPESNFVTAMAVFGNSNSLPVSLTMSLAYSLPSVLMWDKIVDDNSDKIASRGILYLLIFQQLGQILRWSWGYNKLLKSRSFEEIYGHHHNHLKPAAYSAASPTYGSTRYHDDEEEEGEEDQHSGEGNPERSVENEESIEGGVQILSVPSQIGEDDQDQDQLEVTFAGIDSGNTNPMTNNIKSNTRFEINSNSGSNYSSNTNVSSLSTLKGYELNLKSQNSQSFWQKFKNYKPIRIFLEWMNPPLYAMIFSLIVASTRLKTIFFDGGFVTNTLTKAIVQLSSVSIPLILIVLGSNLYPTNDLPPKSKHHNRIIIASLLSRMILPSIFLLPIIACCVKFVNSSILDDPIFLIVAFILTISPPAIQLSQITQLNNIYQQEMMGVLFWGYVILTLPSTIFIVVVSLKVLDWAVV